MKARHYLAACVLGMATMGATAQDYPTKSVKIIVPFAPGGGADVQGRLVAARLSERLKQTFVIENKGGAGGNIGTVAMTQSPPDGYTLLLVTPATAINPSLWAKAGYQRKDYVAAAAFSLSPLLILAHPSVPVKDVKELISYVKANPGKLRYASGGAGAITQINMELLKQRAGIEMQHIQFAGQAPAVTAVVGGQVEIITDSIASALQLAKAGRLRALAVTSKGRSPLMPELSSVVEQGYPDLANSAWYGLVAPAGTPASVLKIISDAVRSIQDLPDTQRALAAVGAEPLRMDSEEFGKFMDREGTVWAGVLKAGNIRIE